MSANLVTEFTPKIAEKNEFIILCAQLPHMAIPNGFIIQVPINARKATSAQIKYLGYLLAEVQSKNAHLEPLFWTSKQVKNLDIEEDPKLVVTKVASTAPADIAKGIDHYFKEYFK